MIRRLALSLCLLASAAALPVAAQETSSWYEVEVIVFKQWRAGGADAELPPTAVEPLASENSVSLRAPEPGAPLTPFARLSASELRLQGVRQVLEKNKSYEPLLHIGWRQPGLGRQEAPAVSLDAGGEPPLYGTVRVVRERFLHAEVDLRRGGKPEPGQPNISRSGERAVVLADGGENTAILNEEGGVTIIEQPKPSEVHRQTRRMRSRELHYLDHPTLGVIIQITPVETAGGS